MSLENRPSALALVRKVLAADFGCDEAAFQAEGVTISTTPSRVGGRRYSRPTEFLEVATIGAGVVVHCSPARAKLLHERLASLDREGIFAHSTFSFLTDYLSRDGLELRGPSPNYVCAAYDLVSVEPPSGVQISVVHADRIGELHEQRGFSNALGYGRNPQVPDIIAGVATRSGAIVGMAGASADSEAMWQIGVDVLPEARLSGIGAALVARVAEEVLSAGRLPYYAHHPANVASAALATKVGFRLAWMEFYAREQQRPPEYWEP